jgi:RNA polymerase sigma-70 factor (ECF subfamily)
MAEPPSAARFPTTHWSRVVAAGDRAATEAREALAELCRAYWYPLYAFVRRQGHGPDDAQDLVQGFFASLLERDGLAALDRDRGRFRSFLRAACAHYLSNRRDHDRALKRGGDRAIVSIDTAEAEGRYGREPAHDLDAERLFERRWAMTLLERAVVRLRAEMDRAGKAPLFDRLQPALAGEPGADRYATIARALGTTEAAVKAAATRLRRRYREVLREEIARTVADPAAIDEEVRSLFVALGR